MSDDRNKDSVALEVARGFAAFKVLFDEHSRQLARLEARLDAQAAQISELNIKLAVTGTDIEHLEEDIKEVSGKVEDVTGKHDLTAVAEVSKARGKEEAETKRKADREQKRKHELDRFKASAPIYIAIVTSGAALITGIINIILHMLGVSTDAGTPPE